MNFDEKRSEQTAVLTETLLSFFPLRVSHVAGPHQQHVMVDGCISPIPCIVLEIKETGLAEPFGRNVKSMRIVFF